MVHDVRIVRLNAQHTRRRASGPGWATRIGWWEGDTLVVETTNMRPEQGFRGAFADERQGHRAVHPHRPEPDHLPLHGRRPGVLHPALARRDGAQRRQGPDLRIRLPRGQLRPGRHPRRRPGLPRGKAARRPTPASAARKAPTDAGVVLRARGALLASSTLAAAAPQSPYKAPRNAFGQPDLSGV